MGLGEPANKHWLVEAQRTGELSWKATSTPVDGFRNDSAEGK